MAFYQEFYFLSASTLELDNHELSKVTRHFRRLAVAHQYTKGMRSDEPGD